MNVLVTPFGAIAQLGEHLLCKQGVSGSIPLSSTKFLCAFIAKRVLRKFHKSA